MDTSFGNGGKVSNNVNGQAYALYANTYTEDSATGARMTAWARDARQFIKSCLSADNCKLLFCGTGCTAAIKRLQEVLGLVAVQCIRAALAFMVKQSAGVAVIDQLERATIASAITRPRRHPRLELLGNLDAPRLAILSFHGARFVDQYHCDWHTGAWHHPLDDVQPGSWTSASRPAPVEASSPTTWRDCLLCAHALAVDSPARPAPKAKPVLSRLPAGLVSFDH